MNITMKNTINNIQEISDLLKVSEHTVIRREDCVNEKYQWILETLIRVKYPTIGRSEKGTVLRYLSVVRRIQHAAYKEVGASVL